jgi:hypothetical protein
MKFSIVRILFITAAISLTGRFTNTGELDWEYLSTQDDIDLYQREGSYNGFTEFRAVAMVNGSLKDIAAILRDFAHYPEWMPECREARKIEDIDENSLLLYYLHHTPWPIRNRDAILRVEFQIDTKSNILYISSIAQPDERFPPTPNPVRMAMMEAHWIIESLDSLQTRISYRIISDPGGSLPTSSINLSTKNLPLKTLTGIANILKLRAHSHPNASP